MACGPANQLGMVAELNVNTEFIGLDLSANMLEQAQQLITAKKLNNVRFEAGDITDLSRFKDSTVDAVISTMALHHLPNTKALQKTFSEVARILKPGAGIYMVDFGHLKSPKSIEYFAKQYADKQPALFTQDYYNSLQAAFYYDDFKKATEVLGGRAKLYSTFIVPFMVAVKSNARRGEDPVLANRINAMKLALPDWHKKDLADLISFFKFGGLSSSFWLYNKIGGIKVLS